MNMSEDAAQTEGRAEDLHFQLSSSNRRRLLSELQVGPLRINEAAKRLDMTATETLRQLQRLAQAGLLARMSDGKYRITSYAKLVLDSAAPLDFISRFREYFENHDALLLPYEFRARLGELTGAELVEDTILINNRVTDYIRNAEKTIDATVVGLEVLFDMTRQRLEQGLKVRLLLHERFLPRARSILRTREDLPEMRWTSGLFTYIFRTDKAAGIGLAVEDGVTYSAFFGTSTPFLRWAGDIFEYEWQRAKIWYP